VRPAAAQQQRALQLLNEGKESPGRMNGPGCLWPLMPPTRWVRMPTMMTGGFHRA